MTPAGCSDRSWSRRSGRPPPTNPSSARPTGADASLYVDECHNFLTLPHSFDDVLAEARGYHLSLILAHQHLGQLPTELRTAVSANARNKISFRSAPKTPTTLERHTLPELSAYDLAHCHRVHRRRPARRRRAQHPRLHPAHPPRTAADRRPRRRSCAPPSPASRGQQPAGRSRVSPPGRTTRPIRSPIEAGIDRPIHSPIALSSDPPNRRIDAAHSRL